MFFFKGIYYLFFEYDTQIYFGGKRNQYLTYMYKLNIEIKCINELVTMLTKTHSNWYYDFDGWKKKARLNCLLMIIIFTKCGKWITIAMNVQITQYKNTISWWLPWWCKPVIGLQFHRLPTAESMTCYQTDIVCSD